MKDHPETTDMAGWLLELHNAVNRRAGKTVWSAEAVRSAYRDVAEGRAALEGVSQHVGAPIVSLLREILV